MLPRRPRRKYPVWAASLLLWMGVIFFSSTALAGKASDHALSRFFAAHLRRFDKQDWYHQYHIHFLAEKSVHVMMFLVLALLLWRILPNMPGKAGAVFLCGTLIGCCSELAQCLFPGRDPAIRDALLNMTGTGVGTAVSYSTLKLRARFGTQRPPHSMR